MYELYGLLTEHEYGYGGYTGRTIEHRDLVATFDTEELAKEYAIKSMLKAVREQSRNRRLTPRPINGRVFLRRSLLDGYEDFEIEESLPGVPPCHNPKI